MSEAIYKVGDATRVNRNANSLNTLREVMGLLLGLKLLIHRAKARGASGAHEHAYLLLYQGERAPSRAREKDNLLGESAARFKRTAAWRAKSVRVKSP